MELRVPSDLGIGMARVQVLYKGDGFLDRGVSMFAVTRGRTPFAILNLETMLMTDLKTGKQVVVGKSWFREGKLEFGAGRVPKEYQGYHYANFGNQEDALEYLREKHPEVELQSPEVYFS